MKKIYMAFLIVIMAVAGMAIQTESISAADTSDFPEEASQQDAIEKYNALLYEWAYDKNLIDDVHANFPDYYGGAYLDGTQLVIQVTELNDAVKKELSGIISLDDVVFEEVSYAYTELVAVNEALVEALQDAEKGAAFDAVAGMGIDIKNNAVSVDIAASENSEAALQAVNACNEIAGFENIKYVYDSGWAEAADDVDVASLQDVDNDNSSAVCGTEEVFRVNGYVIAGLLALAAVLVLVICIRIGKIHKKST